MWLRRQVVSVFRPRRTCHLTHLGCSASAKGVFLILDDYWHPNGRTRRDEHGHRTRGTPDLGVIDGWSAAGQFIPFG